MQLRRLLIVLLTLTISACGFQLRGSFNLPPNLKAMTVDGKEPYSTLLVQTRELLKSAGVETPDDAPYTLYVSEEELGKTRFTQNQNVLYDEFMLTHTAKFELRRQDGTLIMKPQEMTEMTLFQDDKSTAGTKLNEENILRSELAQKLAVKLLRRVQAVKPKQWEAAETSDTKGVATDTLDTSTPDSSKPNAKDSVDSGGKKSSATQPAAPSTQGTGNNAPAP
jgi:LPS-assembly lipoprotein